MDDPQVIAAIRSAISRGVVVNVVKEPKPVGASCRVFESRSANSQTPEVFPGPEIFASGDLLARSGAASCEDQKQLVKDVNQSGGHYVAFQKPELCGGNGTKSCLEHGKIVVVDSQLALVSSGNFNTSSLCDLKYSPAVCNRDYSYITDDTDIVQTLETVFEKDLVGRRHDVASEMSPAAEKKLTVGPNSLEPLIAFIKSAKKSIQVENQYLNEPSFNSALIQVANRGVKIYLTVASACSFGKPKPSQAKKMSQIYQDFDQAGIATKMFNKRYSVNGQPGYLHAKAIVVDGNRAWMGSVNGSTQAMTLNREYGVFMNDSASVKKLDSIMKSDFNDRKSESWQDGLDCAENRE